MQLRDCPRCPRAPPISVRGGGKEGIRGKRIYPLRMTTVQGGIFLFFSKKAFAVTTEITDFTHSSLFNRLRRTRGGPSVTDYIVRLVNYREAKTLPSYLEPQ